MLAGRSGETGELELEQPLRPTRAIALRRNFPPSREFLEHIEGFYRARITNYYYIYHIITVHTEHRLLPLSFARPCFPRDRRPSLTSAKSRILYYILVSTRLLLHAKIQSAALSSHEWTRKNILLRSYAKELFTVFYVPEFNCILSHYIEFSHPAQRAVSSDSREMPIDQSEKIY